MKTIQVLAKLTEDRVLMVEGKPRLFTLSNGEKELVVLHKSIITDKTSGEITLAKGDDWTVTDYETGLAIIHAYGITQNSVFAKAKRRLEKAIAEGRTIEELHNNQYKQEKENGV